MNHPGQLPESWPEPYPSILASNVLPFFVAHACSIPGRHRGRYRIMDFAEKKFHG
jgi:hypothetical protein